MANHAEQELEFRIEPPKIGDEAYLGIMHIQAWKETYVLQESGLTEDMVDEMIGHLATNTDRRKDTIIQALEYPSTTLYRVVRNNKDEVVGFFHCTKNDRYNEVEGLYLLDEAKGSGIGGKLMEEFIDWSDKDKPSHLEVFEFNDKARGFYNKYGFKVTDKPVQLYKEKLPFIEMVRQSENLRPK